MDEVKALLKDSWENHRGKFLGTLLGMILGTSIMIFGFFKTVFVLFCGLIGLFVGKKVDDQEDFKNFVEKIIPTNFRR